jgi:hypothetical protein
MTELSVASDDVALVDLLDRVIGEGVVIGGDIVLSIADVDLVYLGLRAILAPAHVAGPSANVATPSALEGRGGAP